MFNVSKPGVTNPRGSCVTALEARENPRRPRRRSTTAKLSSTKPAAVFGAGGAKKKRRKADIKPGSKGTKDEKRALGPFELQPWICCLRSSFLISLDMPCRPCSLRRQHYGHRPLPGRRRAKLYPRPYRLPSLFAR